MHSSLFHSMTRAGLALLVSSFLLPAWADAAPIREVSVSVTGAGGMPPAVEKRITASLSARMGASFARMRASTIRSLQTS